VRKGLINDFTIDSKLFDSTKGYFRDRVPDQMRKAYEAGRVSLEGANSKPPSECIEYPAGSASMVVFVPADYDGSKAFGLYVHNSPSPGGIVPGREWQDLMSEKDLIYISPNQTQNGTPTWHRIVLALDGMATIKKHYKIDDSRVYVGGLSGGGHTGMLCQMLYPEHFHGAISHAAQSYLPHSNGYGHFSGLSSTDARKSPRKDRKWCVISGGSSYNYVDINHKHRIEPNAIRALSRRLETKRGRRYRGALAELGRSSFGVTGFSCSGNIWGF